MVAIRFGARPLVPVTSPPSWPTCSECNAAMQFVAQLPVDEERLVLVFMCQRDPGMCDNWDVNAGANAVVIVPTTSDMVPLDPPAGETMLDGDWGGTEVEVDIPAAELEECQTEYAAARGRHGEGEDASTRDVVGMLGGPPSWIQGDETPSCDCGKPMQLLAQLEQGPDSRTEINFCGGGCGYVFTCDHCPTAGKMLIQR